MSHAKLYKFSSKFKKDPMSIPLPEMARKVLECQNDKVYFCFKENGEFDVAIGAKNDEEVKIICGEPCEMVDVPYSKYWRDGVYPQFTTSKFSGYKSYLEKSGAIYYGPNWFWWKNDHMIRYKPKFSYELPSVEDRYFVRLKPTDISLEYIMQIVLVQQDATIFKMSFSIYPEPVTIVIVGTNDKDLAKRIFHSRFWINPSQKDLDYVEKNLNVWE